MSPSRRRRAAQEGDEREETPWPLIQEAAEIGLYSVEFLQQTFAGDDSGLGPLLDRIRPELAVISVGAGNSYGHPTAGTLATLAAHDVPVLRTDLGVSLGQPHTPLPTGPSAA